MEPRLDANTPHRVSICWDVVKMLDGNTWFFEWPEGYRAIHEMYGWLYDAMHNGVRIAQLPPEKTS